MISKRVGLALLSVLALVLALAVPAAQASSIVTTEDVTSASLKLTPNGEAIVTYRAGGQTRHVLAWGAVDALPPTAGKKQVNFSYDYSGGYETYYRRNDHVRKLLATKHTNAVYRKLAQLRDQATNHWKAGTCGKYDGPKLAWLVAACKAPDGSYWALQSWQRDLPDYGVKPKAAEANHELHLSHWTGNAPVLTINTDWAWHQWDHLYGTFTFHGSPVYGFSSTAGGQPLDTFGRNVYLDTFGSTYGPGWQRENSFLTHKATGVFCYSVNPHGPHPSGKGSQYRATIMGPGVTPDVMWQGAAPGAYNAADDATANATISALHDNVCKPN